MSRDPEDHHWLLDDDPALDFILYNEMVKDEKRSHIRGRTSEADHLSRTEFSRSPCMVFLSAAASISALLLQAGPGCVTLSRS